MKEYKYMSSESASKLLEAFTGADEMEAFMHDFAKLIEEQYWMSLTAKRCNDDDFARIFMNELGLFTIFCRDNWELITQLVSRLELKNMTDEQIADLERKMRDNDG